MSYPWKEVAEAWKDFAKTPMSIEKHRQAAAMHRAAENGEMPDPDLAWDSTQKAIIDELTSQLDAAKNALREISDIAFPGRTAIGSDGAKKILAITERLL